MRCRNSRCGVLFLGHVGRKMGSHPQLARLTSQRSPRRAIRPRDPPCHVSPETPAGGTLGQVCGTFPGTCGVLLKSHTPIWGIWKTTWIQVGRYSSPRSDRHIAVYTQRELSIMDGWKGRLSIAPGRPHIGRGSYFASRRNPDAGVADALFCTQCYSTSRRGRPFRSGLALASLPRFLGGQPFEPRFVRGVTGYEARSTPSAALPTPDVG